MTEFNCKQQTQTTASCSTPIAKQLEAELTSQFGPVLSGERLSQALGYPSLSAFRQALSRKTVPIPIFTLPSQRGKFALVKDVAEWLAKQRNNALHNMKKQSSSNSRTTGQEEDM